MVFIYYKVIMSLFLANYSTKLFLIIEIKYIQIIFSAREYAYISKYPVGFVHKKYVQRLAPKRIEK